jgi:hypothetical protein
MPTSPMAMSTTDPVALVPTSDPQRRAARRTALIVAAIALLVYVGFMGMAMWKAGG